MSSMQIDTRQLKSVQELAQMTASQQAQYMASLSAAQQAQEAAAAEQAREIRIRRALAKSIRYVVPAQPQGTTGTTAAFAQGQQLTFEIPQTGDAVATRLLMTLNLVADYTPAGTGPTMATNAAYPWSLMDYIQLKFGNLQIRWRPYFFKVLAQLAGRMQPAYAGQVFVGYSDTTVEGDEWNVPATIVSGNNTIFFKFDVPLAPLADLPGAGLVPISGSNNPIEVLVNCAAQVVGNDPLLNTFASNGTVTMSGSIEVDVEYVAGTSVAGPQKYRVDPLDLIGYPTLQYDMDVPLTPLQVTGGKPQRLTRVGSLVHVIGCVIDGNQSNAFCHNSNITGLEVDIDAAAQTPLFRYGNGSKMPMNAYWHKWRETLQYDLDPGIVLFNAAPISNLKNPDARNGIDYMENNNAGWPALYHFVQVGSTGAVTSPRVEVAVSVLNRAGLSLAEVGPQS